MMTQGAQNRLQRVTSHRGVADTTMKIPKNDQASSSSLMSHFWGQDGFQDPFFTLQAQQLG